MRTALKTLLSAAALFLLAPAPAQQPAALSLEEAIAATLADNPAVRAAEYEERAAVQERRATIGLRMPQINVVGAYAYLGKDIGFDFNEMKTPVKGFAGQILGSGLVPPQMIPQIQQLLDPMLNADWFLKIQDRSLGTVGGQVTLPIWLGGKINAASRAAKIQERTAVAQGDQTRNALVSELVERYFGLSLALQVVDVRQQVVDGVRKHLEDAIALEENGMIAKSERLYVEFKMAEAERELANARLQAQTISSALQNTLNRSGETLPLTSMFIVDRIEELSYYQDLAAKYNPLLNQVALKHDLAQEGVKLQRSNFMPQVVAMGGGSFYNYQVTGIVPRWAVGVGVNFKIFDGLNREYKYSAAKQTVRRVGELQNKAEKDISVLPCCLTWSSGNRSALIRIPVSRGQGTRVELRSPDPTCNPYLTLAACLAAGLDGIRRELAPPPEIAGNLYHMSPEELASRGIRNLPSSLEDALRAMEADPVVIEALGPYAARYIEGKRQEWEEYRTQISQWELDRCLITW